MILISAQALGMFHVSEIVGILWFEFDQNSHVNVFSKFKRLPGDANHQQQNNGETSPAAYYQNHHITTPTKT